MLEIKSQQHYQDVLSRRGYKMKWALIRISFTSNIANAWLWVDNKQTCCHLVNVSIKIIKYQNGSHSGLIGLQISPRIRSKKIDRFTFNFYWRGSNYKHHLRARGAWKCIEMKNFMALQLLTTWISNYSSHYYRHMSKQQTYYHS